MRCSRHQSVRDDSGPDATDLLWPTVDADTVVTPN